MPSTFEVVGALADFGNEPRAGVKVRATATPSLKVGDVAVHSNEPETVLTDAQGEFTLTLVSLPGLWYRIQTPYSGALRTVNLAAYVPDEVDPTTGTAFAPGTVIDIADVTSEDPTPGYEAIAFGGTPTWAGLPDKPTLGTAAATDATAYATAGQGAKADTAVQPAALTGKVDKTALVVNALDHGVVADGSTNDAAAWNALVAASAPGTVITWHGRSMLDSPIIWKTGVSLAGQGWGRSVLATRDLTGASYFAAIKYTPSEGASTSAPLLDCTFRDFEVDGSGLTGTAANISGKAIFCQYLRRCQFLNLYLHDTVATALGTDYMPECLIDGVVVERAGRNWDGAAGGHAGIGIGMGAWATEPVTIVNCQTIDCGHWGIFVEYQAGDPFRATGAKIINCTVRGTEGKGIGDRGCAETLIQGCHVSGGLAVGVHISYGAHSGQVLDCTIVDNAGDGIHFDIDTGDGWRVAGNKVGRNGARGIYFDGHTGTYADHTIENNELYANGNQGILIDTIINGAGLMRDLVLRGNRCYNNGKAGVQNEGIKLEADISGAIVSGNRCYDNQGTKTQTYGMVFSASSSYEFADVHVTNNHLKGNGVAEFSLGAVVRTRMVLRNNVGLVTEARGISTIADATSTLTVIHGLSITPTSVVVTPQGANEALWLTTIGSGGFIVNRAGTTGARTFTWIAEV